MINKKAILLIAAGLALIALVVFWLMSGGTKQEVIPEKVTGGENPRVFNSSLKEERDGKVVW